MGFRIAVGGATGNVGSEMLRVLEQRNFPVDEITVLASSRSVGRRVSFRGTELAVAALDQHEFLATDILFLSVGRATSAAFSPRVAARGCVVIDNSSAFRMDPDVPLVVPEVNAGALDGWRRRNILAVANCAVIQLAVVLKPLHDTARIRRVVVASYQSVSGGGQPAMAAFRDQLAAAGAQGVPGLARLRERYTHPFAFNVIPQIGDFLEDGRTTEEQKVEEETRKILESTLAVSATCARVPVFVGHCEAVHLELEQPLDAHRAREILSHAPGVEVVDQRTPGGYAMPIGCAGTDAVFVSRIREDPSIPNGLSLWIVADNVRKGAALNAVQLAELLIARADFRAHHARRRDTQHARGTPRTVAHGPASPERVVGPAGFPTT